MPKHKQCPHCGGNIKHNQFSFHIKYFCNVNKNVNVNKQLASPQMVSPHRHDKILICSQCKENHGQNGHHNCGMY